MTRNRASVVRRRRSGRGFASLSLGAWVILAIAVASTLAVIFWPIPKREGLDFWIFSTNHEQIYKPLLAEWNRDRKPNVNMYVISTDAMTRRMLSGFLSGTPVADVIEVERGIAPRIFSGPLDDVGFVDLTDRLKREGIYEAMNEPSFSPWTSRGHIFGIPHDVHPVMLCYRADIIEAAGIDMSTIETWDDFAEKLRPLIKDLDGDGTPDRYLLNIWYTSMDQIEVLMMQAGGAFFDDQDRLVMDSDANAMVISKVISWTTGPGRIAIDAPEFSPSGNELRLRGFVLCTLMPDWLGGVWKMDLPQLAGKLKLVPLPAWTKGGRHTSVWGGSMLGFTKAGKHFEESWTFGKHLYFSEEAATRLYGKTGIITPVKKFWSNPVYDQPSDYFSGQAPGRLYINLATQVPRRASSPFYPQAKTQTQNAIIALRGYAIAHSEYEPEKLLAEAHRQLRLAQALVQVQMDRNVFLKADQHD